MYLDRLTKELTASLQQLKSTNQLGTYFCDIVSQSYTLEQNIEYFLHKFAGLSLLEVVNSEEVGLRSSWNLLSVVFFDESTCLLKVCLIWKSVLKTSRCVLIFLIDILLNVVHLDQ